ncbi:hypothetical protein BDQ17DRAFT_1363624, partial [Cyathus striatus]
LRAGIILSRSSRGSWVQALKNINGLPDCPDDMSEPTYASLLFENICDICGSRAGYTTEWVLRRRFCSTCRDSEFINMPKLEPLFASNPDYFKFLEMTIPNMYRTGSRHYDSGHIYHLKSLIEVFVVGIEDTSRQWGKWIAEIAERHNKRAPHGTDCRLWLIRRAEGRRDVEEKIRTRRHAMIMQKLFDLGWKIEIEKMRRRARHELYRYPHVWEKKELTDRMWNNMRPGLIQFMEEKKRERLELEDKAMLQKRYPILRSLRAAYARTVPSNSIIPPAGDLDDYRPFRDIINSMLPDQEFKLENFNDAMAGLPEFVRKWHEKKDLELLEIMGAPVVKNNPDYSPLHLATTIFRCSESVQYHSLSRCFMISYPRVLIHDGASVPMAVKVGCHDDLDSIALYSLETKWNSQGQIIFNAKGHKVAKDVVSLCGLDPYVATSLDMDNLDPVFFCKICTTVSGSRCCMRWREAIFHALYAHRDSQYNFTLMTDDNVQREVKFRLEKANTSLHWNENSISHFICTHCKEKNSFAILLEEHMKNDHGIANATTCDIVHDFDVDTMVTCDYPYDELAESTHV